ncbi:MAG: UPF0146 family protein [Candidatus Odinarchaeia archaeon]
MLLKCNLPGADDIAEYIITNYSNAFKIVEIGIGWYWDIALNIKKNIPHLNLVVTDVDKHAINKVGRFFNAYVDDVTRPTLSLYLNASLIYSIRPPPEIHPYLIHLAQKIGSDLLIRPLSRDEPPNFSRLKVLKLGDRSPCVYFMPGEDCK